MHTVYVTCLTGKRLFQSVIQAERAKEGKLTHHYWTSLLDNTSLLDKLLGFERKKRAEVEEELQLERELTRSRSSQSRRVEGLDGDVIKFEVSARFPFVPGRILQGCTQPLQHWLFIPELPWQSRDKWRILQGCKQKMLGVGARVQSEAGGGQLRRGVFRSVEAGCRRRNQAGEHRAGEGGAGGRNLPRVPAPAPCAGVSYGSFVVSHVLCCVNHQVSSSHRR
jgi:hypothetical protein